MQPTPPGKWPTIALVCTAVLLAMSPWFAAVAVLRGLQQQWQLGTAGTAWLTMAVQLGFVFGAAASALGNFADRFAARTLIVVGALLGAGCTALLAIADLGLGGALALRTLTGVGMALVYPVAMRLVVSWTTTDRGLGIGLVVLATTVGSALPHLVVALGGVADWRGTLLAVAAIATVGAVLAAVGARPGPFGARLAPFAWREVLHTFRDRPLRLANVGYLGHMWELYAMWTWLPVFLDERLGPSGRWLSFASIGVGGLGSVLAGLAADRIGRTVTASLCLVLSGACAVTIGAAADHGVLLVAICLLWGLSVVADSAQFSASVSELADPRYVGTQLTAQTALGFLLTLVSIQVVPLVRAQVGWTWTFALLGLGPIVGIRAMLALRRLAAARLAGGRG